MKSYINMINWLKDLFHFHKWKIIKEVILHVTDIDAKGSRFYLQCQHCGKIKHKDIF